MRSSTAVSQDSKIILDEARGLVFGSEGELYEHFASHIEMLEKEYGQLRAPTDIPESDFKRYEKNLEVLLEDPDEIWEDSETIDGETLAIFLREFEERGRTIYHVAVTYLTNGIPSFIYLHFPTNDANLIEKYQRGHLTYDYVNKEAPLGAIEGDALLEGDSLAKGLYEAMVKLRGDLDIPQDAFRRYAYLREETIEEADEIWRSNDTTGNVLVSFIKEFPDEAEANKKLYYIVVTLEDTPSNTHALLFSFPTTDESLVSRYRHGENLQADEVIQEASH